MPSGLGDRFDDHLIEVVEDVELKEGSVGYLMLNQFNQKADEKLEAAVRDLEAKGMKALIIDLRDNPGGLLDVAIDVVSRFVPPRDPNTGRPNNAVVIVESGGQHAAVVEHEQVAGLEEFGQFVEVAMFE